MHEINVCYVKYHKEFERKKLNHLFSTEKYIKFKQKKSKYFTKKSGVAHAHTTGCQYSVVCVCHARFFSTVLFHLKNTEYQYPPFISRNRRHKYPQRDKCFENRTKAHMKRTNYVHEYKLTFTNYCGL